MIWVDFDVSDVLAQLRLEENWKRFDRLLLCLDQIWRVAERQPFLREDERRVAFAEGLAVYELTLSGVKQIPLSKVLKQS